MKKLLNGFIYFLGVISLIGLVGPALGKNFDTIATICFWFLCIVGVKALIDKHKEK